MRCLSGAGTCAAKPLDCAVVSAPCGAAETLCANGRCATSLAECAPVPACPTHAPLRCADGSCVTALGGCAAPAACHPGYIRCASGECALASGCAPSDGCAGETPLRCADYGCHDAGADCTGGCFFGQHRCYDGSCAAATACPAPPWAYKVPSVAVLLEGTGSGVGSGTSARSIALEQPGARVNLSVPAGAVAGSRVLRAFPLAESALAATQAPAGWASWQSSIFSPATGLSLVDAANVADSLAEPLAVTVEATLPAGVALADACLGYVLRLDASRALWQCASPLSLIAEVGSAHGSGAAPAERRTLIVGGSLGVLAPFAVVFSDRAGVAHPRMLSDASGSPPPPPPPPPLPLPTWSVVAGSQTSCNAASAALSIQEGTLAPSAAAAIFAMIVLVLVFLVAGVVFCELGVACCWCPWPSFLTVAPARVRPGADAALAAPNVDLSRMASLGMTPFAIAQAQVSKIALPRTRVKKYPKLGIMSPRRTVVDDKPRARVEQ